ncbi:hypothetical protein NIES4071_10450 [Calothrix sp. NIES-4071]|nr:hypothetical protein NIES4071_10450 [Calothrix sp. NIES-4071]BAZ55386.1 hypothetical protein NIES4105_10410 [Calothrix sp. NIES-4105]
MNNRIRLPNHQQLREFMNMSCLLTSHKFTLHLITTDEETQDLLILAGEQLEILIPPDGQVYYNTTYSNDQTGRWQLKSYVLKHRDDTVELHKLCEAIKLDAKPLDAHDFIEILHCQSQT